MDEVYFPAYVLHDKRYKVFSASKYSNKSRTGTSRHKTREEAQKECDELNKFKLNDWNP